MICLVGQRLPIASYRFCLRLIPAEDIVLPKVVCLVFGPTGFTQNFSLVQIAWLTLSQCWGMSHLHTADHKQRAATEGPTTPCKAVLIINLVHGLTKVFCSQVQAVRLRLVLLATSATIAVFIYKPCILVC